MRNKLAIAALADAQHGVVTAAQLVEAGLSRAAISRLVRDRHLRPLHRGVYAVGHIRLTREGRWLGAVLACGRGALLSHASAAALWGIRPATAATIHVTVPTRSGRARRNGIRVHRSLEVEPATHHGIPVAAPARTLADIKPTLSDHGWRKACEQAEILRLDTGAQAADGPPTRSELEQAFFTMADEHRLPRPRVNAKVQGLSVDFLWPEQRLIVETDGWETHGTRTAFERDRRRDARLTVAGYRVLRFSWRQVMYRPAEVARALAAAGLPARGRTARSRPGART